MKARLIKTFFGCIITIAVLMPESMQAQSEVAAVFKQMLENIRQTHTCSFNLKLHERMRGKFYDSEYIVRLQNNPLKMYVYSINPHPGAEALLLKNENNGMAYINPNGFPYFNLTMSPYNARLRKNHHFTMWEMGFNYIAALFNSYIEKDRDAFYKTITVDSNAIFNNQDFIKITITSPSFRFTNYIVAKNETLTTIAQKLLLNDDMILEANPRLSFFNSVKEGDVIKVPSVFAKKIVLYLDKKNMLPLIQEMYDDKGLYTQNIISSLVRNPVFEKEEFKRSNKNYGF